MKFNLKKINKFIFTFIFFSILLASYSTCSAAWELNSGYPPLPLAPSLTTDSRLPAYILYFFAAGIYIAGAIAAVSLAFSGIQLMMSAENPSRIGAAKERAIGSVVGLVILLGAIILLNTINPQIAKLGITVKIQDPYGLHLTGPSGTTGAPFKVDNFAQAYGGQYNEIVWPEYIQDINGEKFYNCDDNIYSYMIYMYKNTGGSNVSDWGEITCGGGSLSLAGAASYMAVAQTPGVYFYPNTSNCGPAIGTDEAPQVATTTSINNIPKFTFLGLYTNANVRSVKIINPKKDSKDGDFGVMLFGRENYHGSQFMHWAPSKPGYTDCISTAVSLLGDITGTSASLINWNSAFIYQKSKDENPGAGVSLMSRRNNDTGTGARYCPENHPTNCIISGSDVLAKGVWNGTLSEMQITPIVNNSPIPPDEAAACKFFANDGGKNTLSDCFQSLKLDGNFIVSLSYTKDTSDNGSPFFYQCWRPECAWQDTNQVFPTHEFMDGADDIPGESYIKTNAKYIKIIPGYTSLYTPATIE